MIVVSMTLHSARDGRREALATVFITNDGSGSRTRGNYDCRLLGKSGGTIRQARVENWPRTAKSAAQLLAAAMAALYPEKP